MQKRDEQLETYKDAVWDYILEHCDITPNGSYFVKFHTTDRQSFEKHIKGRWKYNYHRHDDRMNFTHKQKEIDATARRKAHLDRKAVKQRKYVLSLEAQKKAYAEMEKQKEWAKKPLIVRIIHMQLIQPLAQKCYTIKQLLCPKNRPNQKRK